MGKMKHLVFLSVLTGLISCKQPVDNVRGIPTNADTEAAKTLQEENRKFQEEGHNTFVHQKEDTSVLMRQYYVAVYRMGQNTEINPASLEELQNKHLEHLNKLIEEGWVKQMGPVGGFSETEGIVIFDTPSQKQADSVAMRDPLVLAGRLEVVVYPWWTVGEL